MRVEKLILSIEEYKILPCTYAVYKYVRTFAEMYRVIVALELHEMIEVIIVLKALLLKL